MKRRTVINQLKGLVELSALARSYFTGHTNEWVGLGLLTEAEYTEYMAGSNAEGKLSKAIQDAEDAVPRPDFENSPRYPKEYLALCARFRKLQPLVEDETDVRNVINSLRDRGYMGTRSIADRLGLQDLAGTVQEAIKDATEDYQAEYWKLKEQIGRKERQGTIARRVRMALADEWDTARKEARDKTEAHVWRPFGRIIERKRVLESLIEKRRDEKLQPISEAMRIIIEDALQKGVK